MLVREGESSKDQAVIAIAFAMRRCCGEEEQDKCSRESRGK
jgi:hypothetical protein